MAGRIFFVLQSTLLLISYSFAQGNVRTDLKTYFDEYKVTGAFVMYDRNAGEWTIYNPEMTKRRLVPASTFDIANALIGLETGAIPDENFVFKWNKEKRGLKVWERDLRLVEAFQNSCIPCFASLARMIEGDQFQFYLNKLQYGKASLAGDTNTFWLSGKVLISPEEQVRFLWNLYDEKLPLSTRSMKAVKAMMLRDDTPRYKLFGKTGWLTNDLENPIGKPSLGWFVGYQERAGNVYFFATVIETEKTQADFALARVDISKRILKQLCVLE